MGIVATDMSMSWYLFGELIPVLLLAAFVARGGIVARWWCGLPPAPRIGLTVGNFLWLCVAGALVGLSPGAWAVPTAFLIGGGNGVLSWQVGRIAVLRRDPRWSGGLPNRADEPFIRS